MLVLLSFILWLLFCQIGTIYSNTSANSTTSVFPRLLDPNFRTVINYVLVR